MGIQKKILNDSLTIFNSKFRFFNILYNSIKLRVANKFLKKYFKNNQVSVLENVNINDSCLTFGKAEEIIKAEDYRNYLEAKNNVLNNYNPNTIYSNDKYCYLDNEGKLIDKETGFSVMVDVFENLELFNAFITKNSAILTEAEKTFLNTEVTVENIVNEEKKLNEVKDLLGNKIEPWQRYLLFFNQNEVFTTYITEDGEVIIYHNRTGASAIMHFFDNEYWFFIDFCSYCLGKSGIILKEGENDSQF